MKPVDPRSIACARCGGRSAPTGRASTGLRLARCSRATAMFSRTVSGGNSRAFWKDAAEAEPGPGVRAESG